MLLFIRVKNLKTIKQNVVLQQLQIMQEKILFEIMSINYFNNLSFLNFGQLNIIIIIYSTIFL